MASSLIGQQIDNYRIEALLGEGGMGAVYRARDVHLDRPVALKLMHPHLAAQPKFQQRFMQEARAAARLNHPAIVPIYHFALTGSQLYMVMAYVAGASLGAFIARVQAGGKVIRLNESLLLLAQVADALDYAHRHGVVHRDIKPDNILLQQLEAPGPLPVQAMVTDFGLAKLLEGGLQTATGSFMGTLPYMSPEQCLGQELDGRSDIYALGVVLYQLATGRLPFNIQSPTDAVLKHLHESPPPPRDVRPGLPPTIEVIIQTALAKEAVARYRQAGDMAAALRQATQRLTDADVTRFAPPEMMASVVTDLLPAGTEAAPPGPSAPDLPFPAGGDQLLINQPGAAPRALSLSQPQMTVGRTAGNEIVLTGEGVSRHHVRLSRSTAGWLVTDLASTNGTFLEGQLLTPHIATNWPPGQVLRVGSFALQWRSAPAENENATALLPDALLDQVTPYPLAATPAPAGTPPAFKPPLVASPPPLSPAGPSRRFPLWLGLLAGVALLLCLAAAVLLAITRPGPGFGLAWLATTTPTPSPTPSPTAPPNPSSTPTQPAPPTPPTPPTATLPSPPTATPVPPSVTPAVPRVTQIYFCPTECLADGSNAARSFPAGTTQVYIRWTYENFPAGADYVRFWRNRGEEWVRYQCIWPGPASGQDLVPITEPDGLRSGQWEVTIQVNGAVVLQDGFTVEGDWSYWSPAGVFNTCYGRR